MPYRQGNIYEDTDDQSKVWFSVYPNSLMLTVVERNYDTGEAGAQVELSIEDARAFAEEILSILEGNDA